MKKNDVLSTLGAIVSVLALFGCLWLIGNYPLIALGGCISILIWGMYRGIKGEIKNYLESRDISKGCKEKVNGVCPHHNLHCAYPKCEE